jgi:hypothetical protein
MGAGGPGSDEEGTRAGEDTLELDGDGAGEGRDGVDERKAGLGKGLGLVGSWGARVGREETRGSMGGGSV